MRESIARMMRTSFQFGLWDIWIVFDLLLLKYFRRFVALNIFPCYHCFIDCDDELLYSIFVVFRIDYEFLLYSVIGFSLPRELNLNEESVSKEITTAMRF